METVLLCKARPLTIASIGTGEDQIGAGRIKLAHTVLNDCRTRGTVHMLQ